MGVEVDLFLFGKPEWEMNMEEVSASEIREKGEELKERLNRIAEIMEKLEGAGWERAGALQHLLLQGHCDRGCEGGTSSIGHRP